MKKYINMSFFSYHLKMIREKKKFFSKNELLGINYYLNDYLKSYNKQHKINNKIYFGVPKEFMKFSENKHITGRWFIKTTNEQYKYIDWSNNDNSF